MLLSITNLDDGKVRRSAWGCWDQVCMHGRFSMSHDLPCCSKDHTARTVIRGKDPNVVTSWLLQT